MIDSLQYIEHSEIPDTLIHKTMEKGTFLQQLTGTTDMTAYAVAFTLALIGAFISLRLQVHKRDKPSSATPKQFSLGFMLLDNLNRLLLTLCLIFVGLRLSEQIFDSPLTEASGLFVGFGLDRVSQYIKNLGLKARK